MNPGSSVASAKMKRSPIPVHPLLVAISPILTLLAANLNEIYFSDAWRSLAVASLVSILLLCILRLVFKDWQRAAILTSLLLILFFSYGHLYTAIKSKSILGFVIGRHRYLLILWMFLASAGTCLIWRGFGKNSRVTVALNWIAAASLILPIFTIGNHLIQPRTTDVTQSPISEGVSDGNTLHPSMPTRDIYYIIPDAYARNDVLDERYGYDNAEFISFLQDHDFYVAEKSTSNYLLTMLSLSSSLNLNYLSDLGIDTSQGFDAAVFSDLIKNSFVRETLEGMGYQTIGVPTGYVVTELYDADLFLTPDISRLDELKIKNAISSFESMLLFNSGIRILLDWQDPTSSILAERLQEPFRVQREYTLSAFDHLETIPTIDGPKFVFIHIISPHRPYLFGPNGEENQETEPFSFAEIDENVNDEDAPKYLGQLTFITSKIEQAITSILEQSETAPIIILQSDHGPGLGVDWDEPSPASLADRRSILNAYYFPDGCDALLYNEITPVNSFRVLFNCYFNGSFEMLAEETYLHVSEGDKYKTPVQFIPVSNLVDGDSQ